MNRPRQLRIAAVADLHFEPSLRGSLADMLASANQDADVLALCGDLTAHGRPDEMRALVDELASVEVPILAVLGNHDFEAEQTDTLTEILTRRGVHVLDGNTAVIQGVGFAGTKGFAGGFGRGLLGPFGERLIKDFVQAAIDEALKLENSLRALNTMSKVVLMHYSPIVETLEGELEVIYAFLGSSRLLAPLEDHGASVVFHGHAHHGILEGRTPSGTPVFNVALPVLRKHGQNICFYSVPAPERRRDVAAETNGGG